MGTGPKDRRGGARAGAGRKPQIVEREFKGLLAAIKREAKGKGMTWQEWFARQMMGTNKELGAKYAKMFMDQIKVRVTESNVTINDNRGPAVYLPEEKPDPAKIALVK